MEDKAALARVRARRKKRKMMAMTVMAPPNSKDPRERKVTERKRKTTNPRIQRKRKVARRNEFFVIIHSASS